MKKCHGNLEWHKFCNKDNAATTHLVILNPCETSPFPHSIFCLEEASATQQCSFTIQQAVNAVRARNMPSLIPSSTGAKHATSTACAQILLGLGEKDTNSRSLTSDFLPSKNTGQSLCHKYTTVYKHFTYLLFHFYVLYINVTNAWNLKNYDKESFCFKPWMFRKLILKKYMERGL